MYQYSSVLLNILRSRQNGWYFPDNIFKCIFLNENVSILLKISFKFVSRVRINNIQALVQIMAWRQLGEKSLSVPIMISLLMHIYITRPQWVNWHQDMNAIVLMPVSNHKEHGEIEKYKLQSTTNLQVFLIYIKFNISEVIHLHITPLNHKSTSTSVKLSEKDF